MKKVEEVIKGLDNHRIKMIENITKDPDDLVSVETLYGVMLLKDALTNEFYNIHIDPEHYDILEKAVENYNFSSFIFDDIVEDIERTVREGYIDELYSEYVIDWLKSRGYYEEYEKLKAVNRLDEVYESGFNGELFACKSEWLNNDYKEFIKNTNNAQ